MRQLYTGVLSRTLGILLSIALGLGPSLAYVRPAYAEDPIAPAASAAEPGNSSETSAAVDTSPTIVRELVEKREENSTSYLLSDGTIRAEITQVATRFRDESGELVDIDPSLILAAEPGAVQSAATSITATFDAQEPGEAPVTLTGADYEVRLDMLGVAENARITVGDTTRYLGVAKDADLEYQSTRTGVKETVVLNSADAPSTYSFAVAADGLTLRRDPIGGYGFYREGASEAVLELGELIVFDSGPEAAGGPAYCPDATMTVNTAADGSAVVTYDVSRAWLSDPARVFPVKVDPTITGAANTIDTYLTSAEPDATHGSEQQLRCGYLDSSTGHNRSLVRFTWSAATIPTTAYVTDAYVGMFLFDQYYSATQTSVNVGRLDEGWGSNTWNTRPDSTFLGTTNVTGENVWAYFHLAPTAQGWVNGTIPNHGVHFYQSNNATENTYYYKRFRSSDYTDTAYLPKLVVTYSAPVFDGTAVDKTVYRIGDTVYARVAVGTGWPLDVNAVRLDVNHTGTRRGTFIWSKTTPSTSSGNWTVANCPGTEGGVIGSDLTTAGASAVALQAGGCSTERTAAQMAVTFAFQVNSSFGDIQDNDLDVRAYMDPTDRNDQGNRWDSGWRNIDTNFDVGPASITTLNLTKTPSSRWFKEVDRNGDGRSDTPNDKSDMGRGSVNLSWAAAPLADGYNVYLYDGSTDRKVAELPGNSATSWSSAGAGIFPKDSDYATRAADSWAANPFSGASSLTTASRTATITVGDGGAGVVVSDGSHLYYRAWTTYPGPDKWKRIGTGLNGTDPSAATSIGPDFTSKPIQSAFLLDGVIYNGYAITPTTVEGVPVSASDGATGTKTLTFTKPLLERTTGASLTVASANVMLAATDERIYSVSYNLTSGDTRDGFRIREYERDGTFVADHNIACTSFYTDGLIADGSNLRFIQWGSTPSRIIKISTTSWKITDSSVSDFNLSREINGCYDPANNLFWMGALDAGYIRRYPGPGLDLRDDPNGLYSKTPGEYYDSLQQYRFYVAPYSEVGEPARTGQWPTLDNRTVRVNDDPRHTSYDLGTINDHAAGITLDEGSLELDTVDLSIGSWGPAAELSRHYSSGSVYIGSFAPGWRFNFERTLVVGASIAELTDATGDVHPYTKNTLTGEWEAPNGDYSKLQPDGSGWKITGKDLSVTRFDSTGVLTSEQDNNGNTVTYAWATSPKTLTITAANGQSIVAQFSASGKITRATHSVVDTRVPVANRSRVVSYNEDAGYTGGVVNRVTRPSTGVEYAADVNGRITKLSNPSYTGTAEYPAVWSFEYGGTPVRLHGVYWPGRDHDFLRETGLTYDAAKLEATIITWPTVDGVVEEANQKIAWNPTGTEASRTNRYVPILAPPIATTAYTYSPQNEVVSEKSPEGVTTSTQYDSCGNVIRSLDGKGQVTANVYDVNNNLIRTTSPAGRTTYSSYDADGNLTAEERVLNAAGERSLTTYEYDNDTQGRGLLVRESKRIDANNWAVTDYVESSFADNGEAQTIIERGVKVSPTASPVDLASSKSFDAFGNLLWEKNAKDDWVTRDNSYDIAGRLLASTDASGAVTHHAYGALGFEAETSRTAGSNWADWKRTVHTADGWLYEESYLDEQGGQPVVIRTDRHSYDAAGNEIGVTTPDGDVAARYDAQGQSVAQMVPGVEAPAVSLYDDDGNVVSETAPGNTDSDEYDYDENGEVIAEDPADAEETSHTFDPDGNEVATYEPLQGSGVATSTSEYDVGGRLMKSTDEKGFVTTFSYDQLDRQLRAASVSASSTTEYNTLGWVLKTIDTDGVVKTFEYDAAGRVGTETVGGNVTSRTYDATGRELTRDLPDGSEIGSTYDTFGRLATETHAKAGVTVKSWVHSYDALGRDIATTETVSGVSTTQQWAGDSPARVSRRCGSLGTTVTLAAGTETALSARSTVSTITATRSVSSTDSAGRPIAYTLDAGVSRSQTATFTDTGKLKGQYGVGLGTGGITYDYSPETARQSSETVDLAYPLAAADRNRTFFYDAAGRLTSAADAGGASYSFAYSADGKITGNGSRAFTYDAAGRLATMTVAGVVTAYTNDTRGRRDDYTSPTEFVDYSYDDADHLTGFKRDIGKNGTFETSAAYTYDASGQRTRSVVTSGSVTTTTTYTYDGLTLLSATSVVGTATTSVGYVNDSAGRPVAAYVSLPDTTTPVFVWIVTDQRGDVLELLDKHGDPLAYHAYTPYGEVLSTEVRAPASGITTTVASGVRDAVELRFAGYSWDDESGLYYCSQRYYDPMTCQWITKDPARADGEESAYQYCGGDPVGKVDPSGEWGNSVHHDKTLEWCRNFAYRGRVADGDQEADDDPATKGGHLHPAMHGYKGATTYKKTTFNKAVKIWKKGGKANHRLAATVFGRALHTLQDIYAHRRQRVDGIWVAKYSMQNSSSAKPDHTPEHDMFSKADPSCQKKVEKATGDLLRRFTKLKKFG